MRSAPEVRLLLNLKDGFMALVVLRNRFRRDGGGRNSVCVMGAGRTMLGPWPEEHVPRDMR